MRWPVERESSRYSFVCVPLLTRAASLWRPVFLSLGKIRESRVVLINLCLNLLCSCWTQLRGWRNQPFTSDSLKFFFVSWRAWESELVLHIYATRHQGNDQIWQLCTNMTLGRKKKNKNSQVLSEVGKNSLNLQLRFRFVLSVCLCTQKIPDVNLQTIWLK